MIDYGTLINSSLSEYIESIKHPKLKEAIAYALMPGGKRLRPSLTLALLGDSGIDPGDGRYAAAAMEMIHTYSLIHDDLPAMDNDDLRRGFPTSHKVYGEAQAILAGDALLTLAFEVLAGHPAPVPYGPCDLILELARAGGSRGVIGGQVEDMEAERKAPDEARLLYIHQHKTARLIEASCRMGCMAAGGTEAQAASLAEYGRCCGLAFQIADDLLDVTSDEATLGKPIGSDRRNEKMTWVRLRGLEAARAESHRLSQQALESLVGFDAAARLPLESLARYMVERAS